MSVIYGTQNVDITYSKFFEPNLYFNSWLIPGTSCTNKHQNGPAGAIYIHRMTNVSAVEPDKPGRNFEHIDGADELIPIMLYNNYQRSRKIYDATIGAIGASIAEESLAVATEEVRMGREQSALAALISQGTVTSSETQITADNVKEILLAERTAISKDSGRANVILASPDTYTALLRQVGNEFMPVLNEKIQMEGRVGQWFGFTVFECNGLSSSDSATYYDNDGKIVTVEASELNAVDFIMYNSEAFSVVDNLSRYKLQDGGIIFNGVAAQVEVNTGFRVTNEKLVRVRKHTA